MPFAAAMEWVLTNPRGGGFHVVLHGATVTIWGGFDPVPQRFDDETAARAHVEHLLELRRKEGFRLVRSGPVTPSAQEQKLGLALDPERDWLQATVQNEASRMPLLVAMLDLLGRAAPHALRVRAEGAAPGEDLAGLFFHRKLSSLRAMVLDAPCGDLATVLDAMPSLERAFVSGDPVVSPLRHRKLRELILLGDPLHESALAGLGRSRLPALEILALSVASGAQPLVSAEEIAGALHGLEAPKLSMVIVSGVADVTAMLDLLTREPLPPDWRRLGVDGKVGDAAALGALVADRAPMLRNLSLILPSAPDESTLRDAFLPVAYEDW